jgi:hypothetical protein
MLSNPQKSLLKRAQRQADLPDDEYREALQIIAGVTSSTDPALGDDNLDQLMAYFEAIYWHKVDNGELPPPHIANAVFQRRHFWSQRNTATNTSRDRYVAAQLARDIHEAEAELKSLGYGASYLFSIQSKIRSRRHYLVALRRTIASKRHQPADCPF